MTIAIIGTRGIPNQYGGFEQFAEIFSVYAVSQGHQVVVYSTSDHNYQEESYKNVRLIHKYNPEKSLKSFGQFVYDYNCIYDLQRLKPDVILQLGYNSSSIWSFLFPKNIPVFTNMDGLEWKRQKYNYLTKQFLKQAEKWAVKNSQSLIADSLGIKDYLAKKYQRKSTYIPYGTSIFSASDETVLKIYGLKPYNYNMLIARMEPENNIKTILESFVKSEKNMDFLVIGSYTKTSFGKKLYKKYSKYDHIKFLGSLYDQNILNNLRYFSNIYCHGHSVGGTNPSLIEAMGSGAYIVAHDNIFNRSIIENDGQYFKNIKELSHIFKTTLKKNFTNEIENNYKKVKTKYNWTTINEQYLNLLTNK